MEVETKVKRVRTTLPKNKKVKNDITLKNALDFPVESMRELTKLSLYNFIRFFWDTYSQDTLILNWHIKYLCVELEKVAKRVANNEKKEYDLIINIPPGTTKTATVSIFFPVWCWVNWYWMRFITTSHSSTLSLESAEYSRDIIRSEKFKMLFPEIEIKQDKDAKSNFRVVKVDHTSPGRQARIEQGGGRVSTSVDARIMGFHAHIIIPDDIIDPKRALSDVTLKTANDHLKTLSTRKTDKLVSVMIMIMQRLHENDPTGYILKKKKDNIKHLSFPGEIINYKKQLKPPELEKFYVDGLLDPVRMPLTVLKEMEADLGQYGYAGQVGQNPVPPGGGMFKVEHFHVLNHAPPDIEISRTVRYWDKAGTTDGGAFTVGLKMCKTIHGKYVILDVKRGQWSAEERERIIRNCAMNDGQEVEVFVEQEPGSGGKESAEGTIRNLAGFSCTAERPTGDKVFRADPFSVQVNNGNVLFAPGEWHHDLIEEYRNFPFSTYKDQVDSGSGAFNTLVGKKEAKSW